MEERKSTRHSTEPAELCAELTVLPISTAPPPVIHYSRNTLLALHDSPLVPPSLPGMKDLSEWYGYVHSSLSLSNTRSPLSRPSDFDLPSSPPGRAHDTLRSPPPRAANLTRANPFANFARFGVDGGLEGEPVKEKGRSSRDAAPHLGGEGRGLGRNGKGVEDKFASATNGFGERRKEGTVGRERESGREARDAGREKKEGRAEEGGWRSVGGAGASFGPTSCPGDPLNPRITDRDRRPRQPPLRDSERRSDRDRDSTRDRDRSGRPAWADDDSASSSAPAWMDGPTSGLPSFGGGGAAKDDGVDGIQAFKKQMREMERREKERESGGPVPREREEAPKEVQEQNGDNERLETHDFSIPAGAKEARPSVFDNLGLGTGIRVDAPVDAGAGGGGAGGRSSRFAKFFDGKPAPAAVQAPQASVFESLMGGMGGGGGGGGGEASREDRESMARLMGMLQVSGVRPFAVLGRRERC